MVGPKVTHRSTDDARVARRLSALFVEEVRKTMDRMVADGKLDHIREGNSSDAEILAERKKLVLVLKEGMLERKDMELEIAVQAGVVWLMRMDREAFERALQF